MMSKDPPLDPEIQEIEELGAIERRKDLGGRGRAGKPLALGALALAVLGALLWFALR